MRFQRVISAFLLAFGLLSFGGFAGAGSARADSLPALLEKLVTTHDRIKRAKNNLDAAETQTVSTAKGRSSPSHCRYHRNSGLSEGSLACTARLVFSSPKMTRVESTE